MNIRNYIFAAAILAAPAMVAQTAETDSLTRAVATSIANSVNASIDQLSDIGIDVDRAAFKSALIDALDGKDTGFTAESAGAYLDNYMRRANGVVPKTVTNESQLAYLDKMAAEPGAKRMPSGIVFTTIEEGTGDYPVDGDRVSVECYSVLSDDSVFYMTEQGKPDDYDVNGVIKGFAEGLKMMRVGGTYRVVIPAELAYGEKGINGVVPGNAALNFTVKLIAILPK